MGGGGGGHKKDEEVIVTNSLYVRACHRSRGWAVKQTLFLRSHCDDNIEHTRITECPRRDEGQVEPSDSLPSGNASRIQLWLRHLRRMSPMWEGGRGRECECERAGGLHWLGLDMR